MGPFFVFSYLTLLSLFLNENSLNVQVQNLANCNLHLDWNVSLYLAD